MFDKTKDHFLVKFKATWSDEFDCEGMFVIAIPSQHDGKKVIEERISNSQIDPDYELYFGTNEYILGEEATNFDNYEIKPIDESQYITLSYCFGESLFRGFGTFPDEIIDLCKGVLSE